MHSIGDRVGFGCLNLAPFARVSKNGLFAPQQPIRKYCCDAANGCAGVSTPALGPRYDDRPLGTNKGAGMIRRSGFAPATLTHNALSKWIFPILPRSSLLAALAFG